MHATVSPDVRLHDHVAFHTGEPSGRRVDGRHFLRFWVIPAARRGGRPLGEAGIGREARNFAGNAARHPTLCPRPKRAGRRLPEVTATRVSGPGPSGQEGLD